MEKTIEREKLTPEEIKFLKEYEPQMETALNAHYLRGVRHDVAARMLEIYNRVCHTKRRANLSCGACVFNIVVDIARIYFADKPKRGRPKATAE